jgi:hypothetical protein
MQRKVTAMVKSSSRLDHNQNRKFDVVAHPVKCNITQMMKRGKLIQTVAYITPKQKADLEKLSAETGASQQCYLRQGVDLVLAKYKKRSKPGTR